MGNQLFQQARNLTEQAKRAASTEDKSLKQSATAKAKNAMSSAFANSTIAEQRQLREMQNELESL
ncbi:DUF3813 domain-containing protein [Aeribacillus pallidus]|jgi:hypothetical protein|uniref:DUF3813 domain-containing protein n=1 Tax=Aeribacillus pallidus TaxID=33936 RepID=UPI001DBCF449|nr:DUF3813 domain-containing protein [Bacillus sp. (in: firmicutes)]